LLFIYLFFTSYQFPLAFYFQNKTEGIEAILGQRKIRPSGHLKGIYSHHTHPNKIILERERGQVKPFKCDNAVR
jgi:hypothetical protein